MVKTFSIYRSSAGSGKTRTLAKEYLKLALTYRADYFKHILAVTFTNKATQEMKDRILAYLDNFANGRFNELAEELKQELQLDDITFKQYSQEAQSAILHHYAQFSISTIDAFFQKVIRSFTREAGLVGDYRLEVEQDAVLEEVINNLIDELGSNKELTDWVVEFAKENLENERAWDVRYSLIEFAREIFREEFKAIEEDIGKVTGQKGFFKDLKDKLWAAKNFFTGQTAPMAQQAVDIIQQRGWTADDFSYGKNSGLITFFRMFAFEKTLSKFKEPSDRIRSYFSQPENWPSKKSQYASDIQQQAGEKLVPILQGLIDCYDKHFKAALSAEVALKNMYVFGLIADIARKLKEYKDENNLMLLADAPKFLNGVIQDSDTPFIYEKVGSFYRNYLIDEFQDTSGMQWKNFQPLLVNSLDQGYRSLVVGDVKQAIYRWRGGDLKLLQQDIVNLIGERRVEVKELDKNFRSAFNVVNFNNKLFQSASAIVALQTGTSLAAEAYTDIAQQISKKDDGFVLIKFIKADMPDENAGEGAAIKSNWRDHALDQVPRMLEDLQENGAALKDIAILVRKNDEGQRIASYLLNYKNSTEAKSGFSYDVVSNESLRIDGAATVNLLLGAMRYLLNPDDAIARAQLGFEFARLHEPERALTEVFEVTNQAIFENNLPSAFTAEKPFLKKLALIELTETLIQIFDLGGKQGELAYLQAFQDLVLEFYSRERNDLGAFLEWWEENKHKKSIQISGEVNAAQILTVHKSKGLQFKYVIIPFCAWSLDHDNWQSPNLWVKSDRAPFNQAGYLPVRYSPTVVQTYFTEYYRHERTRSYLDNLNLLYVAFTRAERGLIALAPHPETRGAKGTVAALVHTCIQQDKDLQANWDEAELVWRAGEWTAAPTEAKETTDALKLNQYLASGWREKLVIRHTGSDYFNDTIDEQRERISYGIHMHAVLSKIRYASEINHVLNEIVLEGLITAEERNAVENEILELMNHPSVASWFTPDWEIRTEAPILIPGGGESRIDRLLINGKKAIVIDFKTGAKTKNDQQQVQQYMDVLRQMNFISIEGYLVYLRDKEVVEVKTGSKQRVVKRKNENQLEIPGLNFGAPEKN